MEVPQVIQERLDSQVLGVHQVPQDQLVKQEIEARKGQLDPQVQQDHLVMMVSQVHLGQLGHLAQAVPKGKRETQEEQDPKDELVKLA